MDSLVRERVEWLTAAPVAASRELTGGFTTSSTWSVKLTDGRHVFVKFAPDDESITANRNEADVLVMAGGSLAPELIGITDDGRVLVTEDLSGADWTTRRFDDDFWEAVAAVGTLEAPAGLFQTYQGTGREWWSRVAYDERFASTVGLDPNWLASAASALTAASLSADTTGASLLHGDLGPGNWCQQSERGWRFVDWASAHRGNPIVDDAIAAIRVTRLIGAPVASPRLRERPEFVALIGGRFAAELLDVDWSVAPAGARSDRIGDIHASCALAASVLGLHDPR